jgi:hypothetical protein
MPQGETKARPEILVQPLHLFTAPPSGEPLLDPELEICTAGQTSHKVNKDTQHCAVFTESNFDRYRENIQPFASPLADAAAAGVSG